MPELTRQKITFGEMRAAGVRGLLIYCSNYKCSHSTAISGDRWPDGVRLSDLGAAFHLPGGQRAAKGAPTSGRISIGRKRAAARRLRRFRARSARGRCPRAARSGPGLTDTRLAAAREIIGAPWVIWRAGPPAFAERR
jgi:hypothetical protein